MRGVVPVLLLLVVVVLVLIVEVPPVVEVAVLGAEEYEVGVGE